jgi:N-acetylglucosaminyldiphosphoundecaprenol N-acetyl-beta-D-mannosaminyltransferase
VSMDRFVEETTPSDTSGVDVSERETISFLGLQLQPKSISELNALVELGIVERRKWVIANHNLHSVYLLHRRPGLRKFYEDADWTHIDGMSLVALARLYGYPIARDQRVTYADWMPELIELAANKGWRVFYVGSPKGVAEQGAAELRKRHPTLQMQVHHGFFDAVDGAAENEAVIRQINLFKPDLLMVGMGMPRQELWIQDNLQRLDAHIVLPSGAAIDYVSGALPTPPRWAGKLGLEWFYRLISEPRRLFGRYLLEPWYVLGLVIKDRLGFKPNP